jgi:iron complex transport system ATP-binding protein
MTGLCLENVDVEARGARLLAGVTLGLERGAMIALVGPNGAGKTTLLRAALGLVRPSRGVASIDGKELAKLSARERAARVAWLPQHFHVAEAIPALELVAAARYRFAETHARSLEAARSALTRVGAEAFAARAVPELSGGERQRVALACLLAQETPFMLLDEPANHLDPAQQIEVYELIGSLWRQGLGVLCVTHDVNLLAHVGDTSRLSVIGIAGGAVRFDVAYDSLELYERLGELFGIHMAVVSVGDRRIAVPARNQSA